MNSILYLIGAILCINSVLADPKSCYHCSGLSCYNATEASLNSTAKSCSQVKATDILQDIASQLQLDVTSEKFDALAKSLEKDSKFQVRSNKTTCINFAIKHELLGDDNLVGVRSCAPDELFEQKICKGIGDLVDFVNGDLSYCETCDDDNCNSAISLQTIPVVVFGIVAFTLKLML